MIMWLFDSAGSVWASVVSQVKKVRNVPRWAVLRLATVTGVSAGWWVMVIASAVTGAVASVLVTAVVHLLLKDGNSRTYEIASKTE